MCCLCPSSIWDMLSFADLTALLYWLNNNARCCVKMELWDGPALKSRHTFFQKSLLSGMGADDDLSFVTSLGASLTTACCWGCRLRGFCTLLGCLWLLRGRDIFVWFYRGNRLLFNALEGITDTETIGNVRRTRYSSKFRHPLVQETSTQQTTIAQDTQGKKVQLQICVPVPFKWVSWTEETDYMATHPL